jgi:hypothetical protein
MKGRRALLWLGSVLLPLGVFWVVALALPRDRSSERATARAVAAQLEGFVGGHASVVRELADRLSQWETLPSAAVLDALRAAVTRQPGLRQLLVADAAGRLVAGYDAGRPPGREPMAPGSLDPVLGRRKALEGGAPVVVLSRTRAGTVEGLDLAAPIRRADGSRLGYVGASVSLRLPRTQLRSQAANNVAITVVDPSGARLYPCRTADVTGGTTVRAGHFVVQVRELEAVLPWPAVLASLGVLLLLALGLALRRILDRRR